MVEIAAWTFVAIIVGLALFQLSLASGAPLGRFAFGGAHQRLPLGYRIASFVSIFVYGASAAIILDRAGLIHLFAAETSRTGAWLIVALMMAGIVLNAISRSVHERFTMTPVALALAGCAIAVAVG